MVRGLPEMLLLQWNPLMGWVCATLRLQRSKVQWQCGFLQLTAVTQGSWPQKHKGQVQHQSPLTVTRLRNFVVLIHTEY